MSVAIVSRPDPFALTKGGRMVYEFSGSGRLQTTGVKAVSVLFLAFAVADDTKLDVTWNGVKHTLTFVSNPKEPNEFLSGSGSADHVNFLLAQFKSSFLFREDFMMARTDPSQLAGIVFTAKRPGKAYTLDIDVSNVGTPFGFGTTYVGADPLLRTQYSIYCELMLQKAGTDGSDLEAHYDRIFSPTIECDEAGRASFDVGNTLHAQLSADWPDWNLNAPVKALNSARKYYIWFGESYGSPLIVGKLSQDLVNQVYLGGGDYVNRAGGGMPFLATLTTPENDPALRYGPLTRYVRMDEPQFLSFVNARGDQTAKLKIDQIRDDGSTASSEVALPGTYETGGKRLVNVGPNQLSLLSPLPAGKLLREYTVRLVSSAGTPLSLAYRYVLNYDYQPNTRHFVYLNSLGAPDTLTTFGKGSLELNRFFEQAERYLGARYEVQDGQFVEFDVAIQQQLEVTTGFRGQVELRGWKDFYRSRERFHWRGGKALPIGITSKTIKQAKDGDTLFAHSFTVVYLLKDEFYTASAEELSETVPPIGFTPVGTITVQPTQVTHAIDDTVSNAVRSITPAMIAAWNAAAAQPPLQSMGLLDQSAANKLYRTKDTPISYAELKNTPTTRDAAGLTDVPTKDEVAKATVAGLRKAATDIDDSVTEASQILVYKPVIIDGKEYKISAPMNFTTAASFIFQNATTEQITWLLAKLKPTLDQVLLNGNESGLEEIIKASQRRTLQLEEELTIFDGRVYDSARKLYLERQISLTSLALLLLATPAFKAALADSTNPTTGTVPSASDWRFGKLLTCEDQFKTLGDDLSNKDFQ